jgi:hypothetical protein
LKLFFKFKLHAGVYIVQERGLESGSLGKAISNAGIFYYFLFPPLSISMKL